MSDNELLYRIALTMLQDVGSITAKKLVAYTGSARAVFSEKYSNLIKIPGIGDFLARRICSASIMPEAEKELKFIDRYRILPLYFLDDNYPERLKHCIDGPLILYLKGDLCLSSARILSVLGTRRATDYGKGICREIIENLACKFRDLVIISGLAYGIDISAHHEALKNHLKTVAVLGHGLGTIYPAVHRNSARRIAEQGALVTDFSSGTGPEKNNFIRRNRIIAGLSDATLVIESGSKGGALITADIASSYHREVLAVPGRSTDNYSRGCNSMIKRSLAALVETADDIGFIMNWEPEGDGVDERLIEVASFSAEERLIIDTLCDHPELLPETISRETNIPLHRVISLLIEMELRGWLIPLPGHQYRLKVKPD